MMADRNQPKVSSTAPARVSPSGVASIPQQKVSGVSGAASDRPSTAVQNAKTSRGKKITADDFKGFIAPVFACFNDDEYRTLNVDNVDKYAAWLKREQVQGICINSITGEGPALGFNERRTQLEAWWTAACHYDLFTIVQIGGAPLPDVLQHATHADQLGVHAILCLPELFFKSKTVEQLVGYCKIVAQKCPSRPFLYYHIPFLTSIDLDMSIFCNMAEKAIPNFMGIFYSNPDLESGSRCIREGRVVIMGSSSLFASGILLGFQSFMCSFLTVRPDLGRGITAAMNANNLKLATARQIYLNDIIRANMKKSETNQWVECVKKWFNQEHIYQRGPRFEAGPTRSYYLKKSIIT